MKFTKIATLLALICCSYTLAGKLSIRKATSDPIEKFACEAGIEDGKQCKALDKLVCKFKVVVTEASETEKDGKKEKKEAVTKNLCVFKAETECDEHSFCSNGKKCTSTKDKKEKCPKEEAEKKDEKKSEKAAEKKDEKKDEKAAAEKKPTKKF